MVRRIPLIMVAVMALFAARHFFEGTPEALALCKAELVAAGILCFVAIGVDIFTPRNRRT